MEILKRNQEEITNAKTLYSGETGNTASTAEKSLQEKRRKLVMTTLWQRMTEMFGNQWELNFGPPGSGTFDTWTAGLAGYSEEQIKNGVEQCRHWDSGFVPNLGQFSKMCLTKRTDKPNFTDRRIENEKKANSLIGHLSSHADSPIKKQELERMKAIMRGEDVETKDESMTNLGLHRRWGAL